MAASVTWGQQIKKIESKKLPKRVSTSANASARVPQACFTKARLNAKNKTPQTEFHQILSESDQYGNVIYNKITK
jgi:hypothetical protein